jgi:hypothetical protein
MSRMLRVGNRSPHARTRNKAVNLRNLVVVDKLVDAHVGKKFLDVYGTRKFITVFNKTRH